MSDATEKDDPFEAIGYQRHSHKQVNQPLKTKPEPIGCPTGSTAPEVASPQRRIEYKQIMEEALIRAKPTTSCHECGGALGSFTDPTPTGRTQLFRFCTGCGVVVSKRLLRGS